MSSQTLEVGCPRSFEVSIRPAAPESWRNVPFFPPASRLSMMGLITGPWSERFYGGVPDKAENVTFILLPPGILTVLWAKLSQHPQPSITTEGTFTLLNSLFIQTFTRKANTMALHPSSSLLGSLPFSSYLTGLLSHLNRVLFFCSSTARDSGSGFPWRPHLFPSCPPYQPIDFYTSGNCFITYSLRKPLPGFLLQNASQSSSEMGVSIPGSYMSLVALVSVEGLWPRL
jgi:hypothetical protein